MFFLGEYVLKIVFVIVAYFLADESTFWLGVSVAVGFQYTKTFFKAIEVYYQEAFKWPSDLLLKVLVFVLFWVVIYFWPEAEILDIWVLGQFAIIVLWQRYGKLGIVEILIVLPLLTIAFESLTLPIVVGGWEVRAEMVYPFFYVIFYFLTISLSETRVFIDIDELIVEAC